MTLQERNAQLPYAPRAWAKAETECLIIKSRPRKDVVGVSGSRSTGVVRRPKTILAADVEGYVRLTDAAEEETHTRLRQLRVGIVNPAIVSYRGQIIKNTGDGFLAAFDSATDAVRCALDLQTEIIESERLQSPDRRISFRMGLNAGTVIVETEDIYGADVNIAVRLEQISQPGNIVISGTLLEQVRSKLDLRPRDLGSIRLKHIARSIRAYSVQPQIAAQMPASLRPCRAKRAKTPAIAILPFQTESPDTNDSYFAEGIIDGIILALGSIRNLLVISRTSTLSYRNCDVDVQKVGEALGVRYVLTGNVRRSGNALRINSQLTDTATAAVIWADRYDGDMSELFDLQDRIATRIVWSVAPHVRETELKRALRKRPENMNAYDLVMQGIDLLYRMNFTDLARAGTLLQNAIDADPNYATAYAYAALWRVHWIVQGWSSDLAADSIEADKLAACAVERDAADGFALAIYGHVKSLLLHEHMTGMSLFDRALAVAPSNAMAWTLSSGVYSYIGNSASAISRAEHGLRLSPVDTQSFFYLSFLTLAHYVNGTYDEAIIWGYKGLGLNPRLCANLRWLCASLVGVGKLDEARHIGRRLVEVQPHFRIAKYAQVCPLADRIRTPFLDRLSVAGLPE
jgi:adenylate cyclase